MSNYPTSYYSYQSHYHSKNGNILENIEKQLSLENDTGQYIEKKNGRIVKKKTIKRDDINKYKPTKIATIQLDHNLINVINSLYKGLFLNSPTHSKKQEQPKIKDVEDKIPSDLTPGSRTKTSKESTKLTKIEHNICEQIIKEFGLEPAKATKKEIEQIYTKLYKELEDKCKKAKNKTSCEKEKKELTEKYSNYTNKKNNCF